MTESNRSAIPLPLSGGLPGTGAKKKARSKILGARIRKSTNEPTKDGLPTNTSTPLSANRLNFKFFTQKSPHLNLMSGRKQMASGPELEKLKIMPDFVSSGHSQNIVSGTILTSEGLQNITKNYDSPFKEKITKARKRKGADESPLEATKTFRKNQYDKSILRR